MTQRYNDRVLFRRTITAEAGSSDVIPAVAGKYAYITQVTGTVNTAAATAQLKNKTAATAISPIWAVSANLSVLEIPHGTPGPLPHFRSAVGDTVEVEVAGVGGEFRATVHGFYSADLDDDVDVA